MSYYRSFANLVSLLGLITLGLIAAAVYVGFHAPRPVGEAVRVESREPDTAVTQASPPEPRRFERNELADLKTPAPVAPPRVFDRSVIYGDLAATPETSSLGTYPPATRELQPLVKVRPIYPAEADAADTGIGIVTLSFSVTALGDVEDIEVVESTDPVFNSAAMDTAARFKYVPAYRDGQPVAVDNVLVEIEFRPERDQADDIATDPARPAPELNRPTIWKLETGS